MEHFWAGFEKQAVSFPGVLGVRSGLKSVKNQSGRIAMNTPKSMVSVGARSKPPALPTPMPTKSTTALPAVPKTIRANSPKLPKLPGSAGVGGVRKQTGKGVSSMSL